MTTRLSVEKRRSRLRRYKRMRPSVQFQGIPRLRLACGYGSLGMTRFYLFGMTGWLAVVDGVAGLRRYKPVQMFVPFKGILRCAQDDKNRRANKNGVTVLRRYKTQR